MDIKKYMYIKETIKIKIGLLRKSQHGCFFTHEAIKYRIVHVILENFLHYLKILF